MKRQDVFKTADLYLAAAIPLLLQTPPDFHFENGRVLFSFPLSDDLFKAMNDYNSGVPLNAFMFAQMIKSLKGRMMQIKAEENKVHVGGK